jgi:Flp pilus assembly protein TadG
VRRHRAAIERGKGERGAAAVEFALVVPILLLIIFAIIVFGFLFAQDLALSNAARQGARFGSVAGHDCDDIRDETIEAAAPLVTLAASNVDVVLPVGGDCATEPCTSTAPDANINVTVTYVADVMVPVPFMGDTKTLTAKGVFRCE